MDEVQTLRLMVGQQQDSLARGLRRTRVLIAVCSMLLLTLLMVVLR